MNSNFLKLLLVSLFLSSFGVKGQDVIIKKDNSTILSKVTKITTAEIEYKLWSNLDGPVYVIDKSEVSGIKYQNGEKESFLNIMEKSGNDHMQRKGRHLTLNGRVLQDEEVKSLVDEKTYNTYISARNQIGYGTVNAALFAISTILAVYFYYEAIMTPLDETNIYYASFAGIFADLNLALLIVNKVAGKSRMSWVADEFNRAHNTYSLDLSPSVIKFKTPQSQNNYAMGVTLRLKF